MNISASPVIEFNKAKNTVSSVDFLQQHTLQNDQSPQKSEKISQQDSEKILRSQKQKDVLFNDAAKQLEVTSDADIRNERAFQPDCSTVVPESASSAPELTVVRRPDGDLTESIRAVRTQLLLRGFPSSKKIVAVTGISSNCGASFFSANLAALFSQVGKKTLLIDANMKNPKLHDIFNLIGMKGLSDVLTQRVLLNETLISVTALPKLTLLSAGEVRADASELLSAPVFSDINETLAGQFDVIFYDTPAFLESTDALMIANQADYVLLVVHKNQSRLADVSAVCKQIADNGIEIIGSVFVDY
jgi:protein-tyrosine kinase